MTTEEGRRVYATRKSTVEPVVGQLKEGREPWRLLLRGLAKVQAEWALLCLTHNLRRLVRAVRTDAALRRRLATG